MSERQARRPALVVGLTGGIGAGKSTVASQFAERGVPVLDADRAAREAVEPGEPALSEIVDAFGPEVLTGDGRLDRGALRARIFARTVDRERLERIVHPRVRARLREALAAVEAAPYAVVEIQLLVESGQRDLVDRVLVVEADGETRIERTVARDGTDRGDVERIIAAQASPEARRAAADDVIDNSGPVEDTARAVDTLHRRYLALAARARGQRGRAERDLPGDAP